MIADADKISADCSCTLISDSFSIQSTPGFKIEMSLTIAEMKKRTATECTVMLGILGLCPALLVPSVSSRQDIRHK